MSSAKYPPYCSVSDVLNDNVMSLSTSGLFILYSSCLSYSYTDVIYLGQITHVRLETTGVYFVWYHLTHGIFPCLILCFVSVLYVLSGNSSVMLIFQLTDLNDLTSLVKVSSIGRPFRPPLRSEEQDGGPSASGALLGWPHSRFRKWGHPRWPPEAEGPPSCSSLLDRGRKGRPRSWLTSFPAPPSLIQDGGATSNVWRTSRRPWRRPTDVCPIHESCRSLTLLKASDR